MTTANYATLETSTYTNVSATTTTADLYQTTETSTYTDASTTSADSYPTRETQPSTNSSITTTVFFPTTETSTYTKAKECPGDTDKMGTVWIPERIGFSKKTRVPRTVQRNKRKYHTLL
ncbi:hypothetical protein DPMN_044024 [Dreissena polymorpha]|uniref:Uncharacterized protein n=1 Tax=Dreissena polymorpha TaxID=45954 RepID=A0A9D4D1J1_DREPO|nr:hypothetical protein DPMN_044024 [Dreissena polymorpha]